MNPPPRVLHVFYDITRLSGYQIRSKYILSNQKSLGLDVSAAFLPRSNLNCVRTDLGGVDALPPEIPRVLKPLLAIDERVPTLAKIHRAMLRRLLRAYVGTLIEESRPDIVHAHSAWLSAKQAFFAARARGVPFLYEVRGFWEESALVEEGDSWLGFRYKYFKLNEDRLLREADAIVTISEGLKNEAISRGARPDKIGVVPNGVDTSEFVPVSRDDDLAESLGIGERIVVGYISSLRKMEGVKYLVEAMQTVDEKGIALVVGDGPEKPVLETLARELGVWERIKFVGAVPHSEIRKYYSLIDIFVVPRIKRKVCEIVTPLKPLEAMAAGKCLLMSDVAGLRELAAAGETAAFFEPENGRALAAGLNSLIGDDDRRRKMGETARRYVVEEREWRRIVEGYLPIYEKLKR